MKAYAFHAMEFAIRAHGLQIRKYDGSPYWTHLAQVAGIVAAGCAKEYEFPLFDEEGSRVSLDIIVAVAWLHDTIEDTPANEEDLQAAFGTVISGAVRLLSDDPIGNRRERKDAALERLKQAPGWVQSIKVADCISNTASIAHHDPSFARAYLPEIDRLLDVLQSADERLRSRAIDQVFEERLRIGLEPHRHA